MPPPEWLLDRYDEERTPQDSEPVEPGNGILQTTTHSAPHPYTAGEILITDAFVDDGAGGVFVHRTTMGPGYYGGGHVILHIPGADEANTEA